jgi:hypothetical protein
MGKEMVAGLLVLQVCLSAGAQAAERVSRAALHADAGDTRTAALADLPFQTPQAQAMLADWND